MAYNVFRWYRGGWGRYTQADPIGVHGGLHLYAYVNGRPTIRTDRFGLSADPAMDTISPVAEALAHQTAPDVEEVPTNKTLNLIPASSESDKRLTPNLRCFTTDNAVTHFRVLFPWETLMTGDPPLLYLVEELVEHGPNGFRFQAYYDPQSKQIAFGKSEHY